MRPVFDNTFESIFISRPVMTNATEQEETKYFEEIKEKLTLAIKRIDNTIKQCPTN